VQNVAVEEQESAQRLVLGRCGDVAIDDFGERVTVSIAFVSIEPVSRMTWMLSIDRAYGNRAQWYSLAICVPSGS
jgi:hypothetical protein